MLSARTFRPSRFQTDKAGELTELRVAGSYAAASGRAVVACVAGGDDRWHQADLTAWVLAFCVRFVTDLGGRPVHVAGADIGATKARLDQAHAAVGGTGASPAVTAPVASDLKGTVLVVPELAALGAGAGRAVASSSAQILDAFLRAPPKPPPIAVPPLVLATSQRLGRSGLCQLYESVSALQNAHPAPPARDVVGVAQVARLGLVTSLLPGDHVLWGGSAVVWTVWSVDLETKPAWQGGGTVQLRDGRGAEKVAWALQCSIAGHRGPYWPLVPDAVLNSRSDGPCGSVAVRGAAPGTPARYGAVDDDPGELDRMLAGHCSYVDLVPEVLRQTRWAVWRPGRAPAVQPSRIPPLIRDYCYGPASAAGSLASGLLMMQEVAGKSGASELAHVAPRDLAPFWDAGRNLAFAFLLSLQAVPRDIVFTGADAATRMLVIERLPHGDLPAQATRERIDAYLRQFAGLELHRMLRLWMTSLVLALNPATPVPQAAGIMSGILAVELGRRGEATPRALVEALRAVDGGGRQAARAVERVRDATFEVLWRHAALDWCKAEALDQALSHTADGPSTAVVYCDYSQRLLALAASSYVSHGVTALAVGPGSPEAQLVPPTEPAAEPAATDGLARRIVVLVVCQTSPTQVLPPSQRTALLLSAPPPSRRALRSAVEQSARVLAPPTVEVPVILALGYGPSDDQPAQYKTLAKSVDIGDFVKAGGSPVRATSAWNAAGPLPDAVPGVVRIDAFASPELLGAVRAAGEGLPEAAEWTRLLATARGLEELVGRIARLVSFEGPSDLDILTPDPLAPSHAPAIPTLTTALAGQPPQPIQPRPPAFPVVDQSSSGQAPSAPAAGPATLSGSQWTSGSQGSGDSSYVAGASGPSGGSGPSGPSGPSGVSGPAQSSGSQWTSGSQGSGDSSYVNQSSSGSGSIGPQPSLSAGTSGNTTSSATTWQADSSDGQDVFSDASQPPGQASQMSGPAASSSQGPADRPADRSASPALRAASWVRSLFSSGQSGQPGQSGRSGQSAQSDQSWRPGQPSQSSGQLSPSQSSLDTSGNTTSSATTWNASTSSQGWPTVSSAQGRPVSIGGRSVGRVARAGQQQDQLDQLSDRRARGGLGRRRRPDEPTSLRGRPIGRVTDLAAQQQREQQRERRGLRRPGPV